MVAAVEDDDDENDGFLINAAEFSLSSLVAVASVLSPPELVDEINGPWTTTLSSSLS
jgi:hypothetical protein